MRKMTLFIVPFVLIFSIQFYCPVAHREYTDAYATDLQSSNSIENYDQKSTEFSAQAGKNYNPKICINQILAKNSYENWLQIMSNTSLNGGFHLIQEEMSAIGKRIKVISVAKIGVADFRRIQDAVDFVPENNSQRIIVFIHAGVYKEKIIIPKNKPRITLQGEGERSTIIQWHDHAFSLDKFGKTMGTLMSASVAVNSDYFVAANLSFQNTAHFPNSSRKYRQAVALRISGDKATFFSCGFLGHQDTLYDHSGQHYFSNCTIQGSIDFIFGNGRSLYENCQLHALNRVGALTAQSRSNPNQPTGFAFVRCRITGAGHPYLGRAWGNFSRVVYVKCVMDSDLEPDTWSDFGHPQRTRTAFYGMYKCTGPGAATAMQSEWTKELTDEEARPFLDQSFINASYWVRSYVETCVDLTTFSSVNPE